MTIDISTPLTLQGFTLKKPPDERRDERSTRNG
jgi:hypothetical protein